MHDVTMKLVAAVTAAVAAAAVVSPGLAAAAVAVTAVVVAAVTAAAAAELQLAYDWLSTLYWRHRSASARWWTPLHYD